MNRIYLTLLTSINIALAATSLHAQVDWKITKKNADDNYAKGNVAAAADNYLRAYAAKPDKPELTVRAYECYALLRDYSGMASALEPIKQSQKPVEKAQYRYAEALKQSGKYKDASREFQLFINNYKGKDYDAVEKQVGAQIAGCAMALKATPSGIAEPLAKVNSTQTDYAPFQAGSTLYYSSMIDGKSNIYKSSRVAGNWTAGIIPEQFKSNTQHVGNMTVTPDGSRMYYTQCTLSKDGKTSTCQIYGMEQKDGSWKAAEKLPEFINVKDANTTHPYIALINDKEYLFYSSDRKGGQGGFDIWVATRNPKSDGFAFTLPVNLGNIVNTVSDEITPSYADGTLYFATDGGTGFGGFDIFQSAKSGTNWGAPQNMGLPVNSAADDMYYSPSSDKSYYVVSNRMSSKKTTTAEDDIFTKGVDKSITARLTGVVTNVVDTTRALQNVMVSLIDIRNNKEVGNEVCTDGKFNFEIRPATLYRLEARHEGYQTGTVEYLSESFMQSTQVEQNIRLVRAADYAVASAKVPEAESIAPLSEDDIVITPTKTQPENIAEVIVPISQPVEAAIEAPKVEEKHSSKIPPKARTNQPLPPKEAAEPVVKTAVKRAVPVVVKKGSAPKVDTPKAEPEKVVTKPTDEGDATNDDVVAIGTSDVKEAAPEVKPEKVIPTKVTPTKTVEKVAPAAAAGVAAAVGTTYKVQIASLGATEKFDKKKYAAIEKLGATIETEAGPNGGTRVVANPTNGNAGVLLKKLQAAKIGGFKVGYKDNVRVSK